MNLEALIEAHGYWIVFVGTFVEGETVVVLAGTAAHHGYLRLDGVILAAFLGSVLCDQIFFFLGRRHGPAVLLRRPAWRAGIQRVDSLLDRYDAALILGFRFLYGLRTISPFAMGMSSSVSIRRFAVLNVLGALVWSVVVAGAGFLMGHAVELFLGEARQYEAAIFAAIAATGAILWIAHFVRTRRPRASRVEPD